MTEKQSYDVFLSYSPQDRKWASAFADSLKGAGVRLWDAYDLVPGDRWQERIEEALRASRALVLILSSHSVDSRWTFFELGAALADGKRIIPVLAGDLQLNDLSPLLRQFQILTESSPAEAGKRVAQAIEERHRT